MKSKIEKSLAIMVSALVISMSFSFALSLSATQVQAQEQWVCCVKDGRCEDDALRSECIAKDGTPYSKACSAILECAVGACIPRITQLGIHEVLTSSCQYNKHRAECEAMNGAWSAGIPALCEKGCCQIPNTIIGRVCMNLPLYVCKEVSRRDGGVYEFKEGTSSDECYDICGAEKLGCCVIGGGECSYGIRGECEGTFYEGLYCYQVGSPQCVVEHHAYEACCSPLTVRGGEIKRAICSFDSAGNQEETLRECPYPEAKCEICNKEACLDWNKSTVDFGKPYCKDRSCYLEEEALGSQELEEITSNRVKFKKINAPEKLLHGQSICYNFFSHYQKGTSTLELNDRSTGLQNQIIRCVEGELENHGLGTNRKDLCVQVGPTAKTFSNNWEKCRECATASGMWNAIQDAFLAIPDGCWRILFPLKLPLNYCTKETCEALGKVRIDGVTEQICWYNYDTWERTRLGKIERGIGKMKGVGSCDPIYPPGTTTQCAECGGGGDFMYNVCDKAECYSLGNCQTESLGTLRAFWHNFYGRFIPAFMASRISLAPGADCVAEAIYQCGIGPQTPACYGKCLLDRTKYINPLCWVAAATKDVWSGKAAGKWISTIGMFSSVFGFGLPPLLRAGMGMISIWGLGREEKAEKTTPAEASKK